MGKHEGQAPVVPGETGDTGAAATTEAAVTGTPATGTPDTGTPDTGTPDTGTPDTGATDTGTTDAVTSAIFPAGSSIGQAKPDPYWAPHETGKP